MTVLRRIARRTLAVAAFCIAVSTPAQAAQVVETGVKASVKTVPVKLRSSEAEALALVKAYSLFEVRRKSELHNFRMSLETSRRKDSSMEAMFDVFPDLPKEMVAAMSANIVLYRPEFELRYFPAATAIVRENVTREDVRELTIFYASAFGQKLLQMGAEDVDESEIVKAGLEGVSMDAAAIDRRAVRSSIAMFAKLNVTERQQLVDFSQSAVSKRFKETLERIRALQADVMGDPGSKFVAANEREIIAVMKRVTGVDIAPKK